jgi:hypothetical protein
MVSYCAAQIGERPSRRTVTKLAARSFEVKRQRVRREIEFI